MSDAAAPPAALPVTAAAAMTTTTPATDPAADPGADLAIIGAGPVGLALALHAARALPTARLTLYDARPLDLDVGADPRTLALSLGSVWDLERLGAWPADVAEPILEVAVSQQPPSGPWWAGSAGDPVLTMRATDEGVPMLGAVLRYGQVLAPLQSAWLAAAAREPARLRTRFGTPVAALKPLAATSAGGPRGRTGVEVDAGIVERHDLAIVAEGGVFSESRRPDLGAAARTPLRHDYRQTAWVGTVTLADDAPRGVAHERFTRHGPAALLPLPPRADGTRQAALVWCVPRQDDPVRGLDDAQRLAVLGSLFPATAGRLVGVSPLKAFPLGLQAEPSLVQGRIVRIGNAAQMLHPVAGQGLNLGLRDARDLVQALARPGSVDAALRRLEFQRAPDRWAMIAATDFLARSFTWRLPGAGAARGLGLAALQRLGPLRSRLARRMMFGG